MKYSVQQLKTPVCINDVWFGYRLRIWEPATVTEDRIAPYIFARNFYVKSREEAIAQYNQLVKENEGRVVGS